MPKDHSHPAESLTPEDEARGFKRFKDLSYTARVTVAFALISLMTVVLAFSVLSFVWEHHFQSYARDNLAAMATSSAEAIAASYENFHRWGPEILGSVESLAYINPNLAIQVVDASGGIRFDSSQGPDATTGLTMLPRDEAQFVSAPIEADGQAIGAVNMWTYGTNSLLTSSDVQFRNSSYTAMFIVAALALVLSLAGGFIFARKLVDPINRISKTARAITKGDGGARTRLRGNDEISRLGETFDAMADSIEKDREMERRLTTDVAHELRTPLMAIQSTVEAMVDGVFEPDQERLATIDSEVQRLSRLVDALLKLSRLENRKIPMKKERLNLGDLIEGIVSTHEAYVHDSGLDFSFAKQDDVYVYGDPDMLRQATANLISNAVRYTPAGGAVMVRVEKGDIMGRIVVQDTGIGLSPEEAKMVFSRFWRAEAGRNRAQGGLGVGLSVVKEIVDRHNGWVRVEGKKDEGAKFTIFIPLYDERRLTRSQERGGRRGQSRPQSRMNRRDRQAHAHHEGDAADQS